jgi:hypothetical protein
MNPTRKAMNAAKNISKATNRKERKVLVHKWYLAVKEMLNG